MLTLEVNMNISGPGSGFQAKGAQQGPGHPALALQLGGTGCENPLCSPSTAAPQGPARRWQPRD